MIHGSLILADDTETTVKIVFFAIVGVAWLIGQIASAANKSAKKNAQRPRALNTPPPPIAPPQPFTPFQQSAPRRGAAAGFPPQPPSPRQPPMATIIGRPGGPATTLQEARRQAQARAVQARAAAARAAQLQAAQARADKAHAFQATRAQPTPIPPPAPRRGAAAGFPPTPIVPFASQPLAQPTPASAVTAPARRAAAPPPPTRAAAPLVSATRTSAIRPNLTPQSLRSQFVLTEILGPPVTLRQ